MSESLFLEAGADSWACVRSGAESMPLRPTAHGIGHRRPARGSLSVPPFSSTFHLVPTETSPRVEPTGGRKEPTRILQAEHRGGANPAPSGRGHSLGRSRGGVGTACRVRAVDASRRDPVRTRTPREAPGGHRAEHVSLDGRYPSPARPAPFSLERARESSDRLSPVPRSSRLKEEDEEEEVPGVGAELRRCGAMPAGRSVPVLSRKTPPPSPPIPPASGPGVHLDPRCRLACLEITTSVRSRSQGYPRGDSSTPAANGGGIVGARRQGPSSLSPAYPAAASRACAGDMGHLGWLEQRFTVPFPPLLIPFPLPPPRARTSWTYMARGLEARGRNRHVTPPYSHRHRRRLLGKDFVDRLTARWYRLQ